MNDTVFPGKLLLFGEHILLLGAPALAVPAPGFSGVWAWGRDNIRHHERLLQFAASEALRSLGLLDLAQFGKDLDQGLYFQSDIPTGYGLGSSGALCAAIYARYCTQKTSDLVALKAIFSQMEGFFHGNSSGIDPLTSYVGEPMLIENKSEVRKAHPQQWEAEPPIVFLLDSELPRRTGPLVSWFLAQNQTADFSQKLSEEYLPANAGALHGWLSANAELFWPNLRRLSAFQFEHFIPMIPETLKDFWSKSLEIEDYTLKICGAGGGGFVLGFAKNEAVIEGLGHAFKIMVV